MKTSASHMPPGPRVQVLMTTPPATGRNRQGFIERGESLVASSFSPRLGDGYALNHQWL